MNVSTHEAFYSRSVYATLVCRYIKLVQQIKHLLIITYFSILKCPAPSAEENISVICFRNCYPELLLSLRSTGEKAKQWAPCSWLCQELWGTFIAPVPFSSRVFSKEEIKAMVCLMSNCGHWLYKRIVFADTQQLAQHEVETIELNQAWSHSGRGWI